MSNVYRFWHRILCPKFRSHRRNKQTNKRTNKREKKKAFNEFVNFKIIAVASSPMFHISNILRLAKMLLFELYAISVRVFMYGFSTKQINIILKFQNYTWIDGTAKKNRSVWLMKLGWLQPHFIRAISTEPNANADQKKWLNKSVRFVFFLCVVLRRFLSETRENYNFVPDIWLIITVQCLNIHKISTIRNEFEPPVNIASLGDNFSIFSLICH